MLLFDPPPRRTELYGLVALVVLLTAQPIRADRSAAILAINDVYRIEGADHGRTGGLARVRTLRKELEERIEEFRRFAHGLAGRGRGILVVGNVSPLSHVGEIADRFGIPIRFEGKATPDGPA